MNCRQCPNPTAGTSYEPILLHHEDIMEDQWMIAPLPSENELRISDDPNPRYIKYNCDEDPVFHTFASVAKEDPDRIHAVASVAKDSPRLPVVTFNLSEDMSPVTFLADVGRSTSSIRPQDLPCSCKECTDVVESDGLPIDINGTVVQHPFTVSSELPLSVLGHDLLSKLESVWTLLHLTIQADSHSSWSLPHWNTDVSVQMS